MRLDRDKAAILTKAKTRRDFSFHPTDTARVFERNEMDAPPAVPSPPVDWIRATAAARRLGIPGREVFRAEIGRLNIRSQRLGKSGILFVAASDVERAAQQLAMGGAT